MLQKLKNTLLFGLALASLSGFAVVGVAQAATSHSEFACQDNSTNLVISPPDTVHHQTVVTCKSGSKVVYVNYNGLQTVAVDATCSGTNESIGTGVDTPNAPTTKYIFYCVITSGNGDNSQTTRTNTTPTVAVGVARNVLCSDGVTVPKDNNVANCPADVTATDPATGVTNCSDTTNLSNCDLVTKYINPLINFLAALVGVAVVISIIVGGIQYSSSAGDPQKVTAAKARIRNAIIALLAFLFLYAMLNFLIPGGLV